MGRDERGRGGLEGGGRREEGRETMNGHWGREEKRREEGWRKVEGGRRAVRRDASALGEGGGQGERMNGHWGREEKRWRRV